MRTFFRTDPQDPRVSQTARFLNQGIRGENFRASILGGKLTRVIPGEFCGSDPSGATAGTWGMIA